MEQKISYPILASTVNNNDRVNRPSSFTGFSDMLSSDLDDIMNSPSPGDGSIATVGRSGVASSESIVTSDSSNPGSNRSDLSMNIVDEEDPVEVGHSFDQPSAEKESCKVKEMDDVDGNNQKSKLEEDGESDDMLGGVFAFEECEYFFS